MNICVFREADLNTPENTQSTEDNSSEPLNMAMNDHSVRPAAYAMHGVYYPPQGPPPLNHFSLPQPQVPHHRKFFSLVKCTVKTSHCTMTTTLLNSIGFRAVGQSWSQ